jgi:nucleoside-diphosphate-sugar epimerase
MQYAPDVAAAFIAASRASDFDGAGVFDLPGTTVNTSEIAEAIALAAPGARVRARGLPLPFPAEVDPSPDAPTGLNNAPTPFSEGVRETIERFRELQARGQLVAASP